MNPAAECWDLREAMPGITVCSAERRQTFLTSARMGILMCPKPPLLRGVLIHARCTCQQTSVGYT